MSDSAAKHFNSLWLEWGYGYCNDISDGWIGRIWVLGTKIGNEPRPQIFYLF